MAKLPGLLDPRRAPGWWLGLGLLVASWSVGGELVVQHGLTPFRLWLPAIALLAVPALMRWRSAPRAAALAGLLVVAGALPAGPCVRTSPSDVEPFGSEEPVAPSLAEVATRGGRWDDARFRSIPHGTPEVTCSTLPAMMGLAWVGALMAATAWAQGAEPRTLLRRPPRWTPALFYAGAVVLLGFAFWFLVPRLTGAAEDGLAGILFMLGLGLQPLLAARFLAAGHDRLAAWWGIGSGAFVLFLPLGLRDLTDPTIAVLSGGLALPLLGGLLLRMAPGRGRPEVGAGGEPETAPH